MKQERNDPEEHPNEKAFKEIKAEGLTTSRFLAIADGDLITEGDEFDIVKQGALKFNLEEESETGIWIFDQTNDQKPPTRYMPRRKPKE